MKNYFLLFLFFPAIAFAQEEPLPPGAHLIHVLSGTGFFVNREYVLTNAHVVKGCDKVTIKGGVPEQEAAVTVADDAQDLALIHTAQPPDEFAPLRVDISDLKIGDKLYIIGYPGLAGINGEYKFSPAKLELLNAEGRTGVFYVSNVIDHGNSGGPVFDESGNVIGVVVAKTVLTMMNKETQEKISEQPVGVAINLAVVKDFLLMHGVYVQWASSNQQHDDDYIQSHGKDYSVRKNNE